MAEYIFSREINGNGAYNVNNGEYKDGEGFVINLYKSLESALPGIKFNIIGNATSLTINTDVPLDAGQQTTLSTAITNYKAQGD